MQLHICHGQSPPAAGPGGDGDEEGDKEEDDGEQGDDDDEEEDKGELNLLPENHPSSTSSRSRKRARGRGSRSLRYGILVLVVKMYKLSGCIYILCQDVFPFSCQDFTWSSCMLLGSETNDEEQEALGGVADFKILSSINSSSSSSASLCSSSSSSSGSSSPSLSGGVGVS